VGNRCALQRLVCLFPVFRTAGVGVCPTYEAGTGRRTWRNSIPNSLGCGGQSRRPHSTRFRTPRRFRLRFVEYGLPHPFKVECALSARCENESQVRSLLCVDLKVFWRTPSLEVTSISSSSGLYPPQVQDSCRYQVCYASSAPTASEAIRRDARQVPACARGYRAVGPYCRKQHRCSSS
jgi:hypothetical protein